LLVFCKAYIKHVVVKTLIIHKTCEVYSLWFFEELCELIRISRGVHLDLSNGVSTTVCGVF
jgi:hypothetical protein